MRLLTCMAAILFGSCVVADEPIYTPETAQKLFMKRLEAARAEYIKEEEKARAELVERLQQAQEKATSDGKLDEAIKIRNLLSEHAEKSSVAIFGITPTADSLNDSYWYVSSTNPKIHMRSGFYLQSNGKVSGHTMTGWEWKYRNNLLIFYPPEGKPLVRRPVNENLFVDEENGDRVNILVRRIK